MGFEGDELEARTRAFVITVSLELGIYDRLNPEQRLEYLKAIHRFFTSKK